MKVVDRDDPKKKWGDEKDLSIGKPIYAGENSGDMVSFGPKGAESWSSLNWKWTATGPNDETINGPNGVGKTEWTINNDDDDAAVDWMKWKPGKWKIKLEIGPNIKTEFEQEVGWRTEAYLVIGQIVPTHKHDVDAPSQYGNLADTAHAEEGTKYRLAVAAEITSWAPGFATPIFADNLARTPTLLSSKLSEAWFAYWGLLYGSFSMPPKGPFTTSHDTSIGSVLSGHRSWMIQHMLNISPDEPIAPDEIEDTELDAIRSEKQFRILHRLQGKFIVTEEVKIKTDSIRSVYGHLTSPGSTKIRVGFEDDELFDGSPGVTYELFTETPETADQYNGTLNIAEDRTKFSGYASFRIGEQGRKVNWRLIGKDAPWIFSEIIFQINPDRTVENSIRTSVDITWKNGSVTSGQTQFNNLNIYKAATDFEDSRTVYERKGILEMEETLKPFVDSASGAWPEPQIEPSVK